MDFSKHNKALNTVHYALYGINDKYGAYKVASMFYYQDYEHVAYEQLDAYLMSRNIAIQCDDLTCIKELDIQIAHLKNLIATINDGDKPCH